MLKFPRSGLYVITKTVGFTTGEIVTSVEEALKGGADVVQYRDKNGANRRETANQLLTLCRDHQVPLIINDDVDLAHEIGADGVHLGEDDCNLADARARLGSDAIIGISCYASPTSAKSAEEKGASYIAFGRFFPSKSKPNASPSSIEILKDISVGIPVVAIGGITPKNGKSLLDAGANLLAVIDAVCGQENPKQAALEFKRLFEK